MHGKVGKLTGIIGKGAFTFAAHINGTLQIFVQLFKTTYFAKVAE